jgi:hypothetical protein
MAKKFLTPIKLANMVSDPIVGTIGEVYFNVQEKTIKAYDGEFWYDVTGSSMISINGGSATTVFNDLIDGGTA